MHLSLGSPQKLGPTEVMLQGASLVLQYLPVLNFVFGLFLVFITHCLPHKQWVLTDKMLENTQKYNQGNENHSSPYHSSSHQSRDPFRKKHLSRYFSFSYFNI